MSTELLERTAARGRFWDPRVAGGLLLLLVFLCGAAAGALATNSGLHERLHLRAQPAFDTTAGKALNFDKLQKELNLSPSQAEELKSILADMWQYYRTVLTDSKSRVEQVLTPEQRLKFEHLLQQQR